MKILFVEKRTRTDKLGILYLASILSNAGHSVDLIQTDLDNIDEYLEKSEPEFIMYSVMSAEKAWFLRTNLELKKKYAFKSVMGGPHFTFFPEEGMEDEDVDFVVQGPGEGVILDIVEGRTKNKFVLGHLPDINSLPEPKRDILYKYDEFGKSRMKRFIAGRYCLFSCTYCFNHLFKKLYRDEKGQFFQRNSPERMIEEIKHVKEQYGLELAYFNDDDFAANKEWLSDFCDKFRPLGMEFCGSIRASSVDYDSLKMMRDAGCTFMNIAMESANPKTQKFLRRGFVTNEQIINACKISEELGIKIRLQNMVGLPVENPLQDALETLEMNQKINPTDSWASIFQPFPRTDLWQFCIDNDIIDDKTDTGDFFKHTVLKIPDAEKIDRLQKWWFFAIKYQIPIEVIKVLIELPYTEEQLQKLQDIRWDIGKRLLYGI
jgi:radical SAM superfamily enzyme YgiQ (UPF0313 family)